MIGQRIESQPGFPVGAVIWLVIGAAFAVPAVIVENPHFGIVAALPAAIGLVLLMTREPPFEAELGPNGLEIEEPTLSLPYAAIEAVLMVGKPGRARAAIQLIHADGVVHIPARLNIRSDDLCAFLLEQLPTRGTAQLPGELQKYHAAQERMFGSDRVYSYRARSRQQVHPRKRALCVCAACAVAGLIWAAAGALLKKDGEAWIAIGLVLVFFSGMFALLFYVGRKGPRMRDWHHSGLVIGPAGLALLQGDLRGELRWDELRKIRFRKGPSFLPSHPTAALAGIDLIVEGATITIADIYDRPLAQIHERLRTYWMGGGDRE
jgi:hypothetical protein